uniref:hypothetical protein n=1 Tax=Acetatifactor sp. TaxID=1872090 RepID=UPI004055B047
MKESASYNTEVLQEHILFCDNLDDFSKEILSLSQNQRVLWKEKIASIMWENNYTLAALAKACGVSHVAVRKWCDGALPQSRDLFIRIGFAAHYSLEEMNRFLNRYGCYPALYSKSLEDSVYIFVLSSDKIPHTFEMCERLMEQLRISIQGEDGEDNYKDTVQMLMDLINLETERELISFVQKNSAAYKHAYRNFYEYIKKFVEENSMDAVTGKCYSLHAFADLQGWSSSLRKCVSAIYKGSYFPLRRKVIALGLFLNMDLSQINVALCLANMEELYVKNPLESAIIYALEDARLNDMICCDGSVELVNYVCEVLKQLQIPEAEEFVRGLSL